MKTACLVRCRHTPFGREYPMTCRSPSSLSAYPCTSPITSNPLMCSFYSPNGNGNRAHPASSSR